MKHPWRDNALALEGARSLALGKQHRLELQGEGEHPALVVLRRTRIEAHRASQKVDLARLQASDLAQAPAHDVHGPHEAPIDGGEVRADAFELLRLEEPRSGGSPAR